MRIAVIDYDLCNPVGCGGYLCERVCPVNRMDKKCIAHEPEQKPVISEALCIDCQLCVIKCPFHAISIVSLTAKLDEPIHQYGVNSFRVYRLPYPRPGSVVGLIGVNGIGKTTVLRALAGQLVPNLGDYSKPASYDQLVEHFRGKEIQEFFKQARDRGLKFSYKPQNMDDLPKVVKGKVEALLRKVDERKQFEAVVESLNLSKVLDRELRQLSGGELQRVAIAASALKDADLYAFDEPSSYLDVSERLRMARVLKGLTANNKSVLVIEHDLAVLDYLSDYVHILFGKKGTYGVVSNPKTCKNGINEFLQGFIPDENLRFRARELRFEVRPPHDTQKRRLIAEFPALHKSFKGFKLSTEGGDLREGEVIGVLGPNGIGKTTFVKLLAGLEKPDEGVHDLKLRVSYKPQYLVPEAGLTVRELFDKYPIDLELFGAEVDKKLRIVDVMDHAVESLSGGELQKVSVALSLCQEADVFLLDEPSAFIDVEDRLAVADCIRSVVDKKKKVALVVDHDILFQDYVSDRLIVFEGESAVHGHALKPSSMREGMNLFLKNLGITYRRDEVTGRPRANKPDSVKDREQKASGDYYYASV
ncbi:MAG: ribosome biogenesis/translation initiation ATPase RLI [Candidatus Diapherotrites archaeon]|uniref:Ribosome biogenesis/translation initiation ATPase RLI n=1 Tax=Candidatus Iainarchaeum sp. TaxID=3101447 RepID=A0A8T4L5F1_9ARCH|nr:ribosome biogenesis/translation initiation ATPase RLI [Candidatus Diapherotrites archaeon]